MVQDKLLIWKCKRGNQTAFKRIYEKYESDLRTLAANLLEDKVAAEDIVQDVFISFLQILDKFELRNSLSGYLKTCVVNKSRDYARKRQRETNMTCDFQPVISDNNWPVQLVIKDEQVQKLCSAMGRLSYEHREAVVLRLLGQMRFKMIAKLQNTSIKTVFIRYRTGLDELKKSFNSEMEK